MSFVIDPDTFISDSLETAFGLKTYLDILRDTQKAKFEATAEFRKKFNGYYKVRQRSPEWYKTFFDLFEKQFNKEQSFEYLLREMYKVGNSIEVSFVSKLMATVKPEKPIWDKYVIKNIGLESEWKSSSKLSVEERIKKAKEIYDKIAKRYDDLLKDEIGKKCIERFNQVLPKYKDSLSDVKKIDCILWSKRKF